MKNYLCSRVPYYHSVGSVILDTPQTAAGYISPCETTAVGNSGWCEVWHCQGGIPGTNPT